MSNIIPFDTSGKNLPAYLSSFTAAVTNALAAHKSVSFPVISIKGKVWTIVRGGERHIIPNPKDPESPANYIDVVILKANPNKSKVWYASGYVEGSEGKKPDCFSRNGEKPDDESENPQSKICATCKQNQWEMRLNEKGVAKKSKACQDTIRLAIATPDNLNDPYLLRVPPASIKPAGEYGAEVAKRGMPLEAIVTRISFDQAEATPKLMFKPVAFLDETSFKEAREMGESELVENILGTAFVPEAEAGEGEAEAPAAQEAAKAVKTAKASSKVEISKDKKVTDTEVKAAVKAGEAGEPVAAAPAVTTDPEPVPAPVSVDAIEVEGIPDLSKITFDD